MATLPTLLAICEGNPLITGWLFLQRASNTDLWCFSYCYPEGCRVASDLICHGIHVSSLQWLHHCWGIMFLNGWKRACVTHKYTSLPESDDRRFMHNHKRKGWLGQPSKQSKCCNKWLKILTVLVSIGQYFQVLKLVYMLFTWKIW